MRIIMSHKRKKKNNKKDVWEDPYPDMNDEFAYIAGYTGYTMTILLQSMLISEILMSVD